MSPKTIAILAALGVGGYIAVKKGALLVLAEAMPWWATARGREAQRARNALSPNRPPVLTPWGSLP